MITVFYDGQCHLCAREINYYRRIAPPDLFTWRDVTKASKVLDAMNISLVQALKLLHVQDTEGKIHIGVDGFIAIWRQLDYWRHLASFVALPIIRPLVNFTYHRFANWRFKRLTHCQIALANTDNHD